MTAQAAFTTARGSCVTLTHTTERVVANTGVEEVTAPANWLRAYLPGIGSMSVTPFTSDEHGLCLRSCGSVDGRMVTIPIPEDVTPEVAAILDDYNAREQAYHRDLDRRIAASERHEEERRRIESAGGGDADAEINTRR